MKLQKMVLSALFLALAMVLPFLTGQIPQIGNMLSPMHIPILLAGLLCGWPYGLLIGFIAPPLRFLLFGMPPIFPVGIAMAFELAAYGFIAGYISSKVKNTLPMIYVSLIFAMIGGRIVWGLSRFIIAQLFGLDFTLNVFFAGAFVTAIPGIIVQIILIPAIVMAINRYKLMNGEVADSNA